MSLGKKSTSDELILNDSASNEDTGTTKVSLDLFGVTENLPSRKKPKQFDAEMIIMGHELSDLEINIV